MTTTTGPILIRRATRVKEDLLHPMVMNMTMAQVYGMRSKGKPYYSRDVADLFAAIELAIAKAGKRNRRVNTDDVILAALAIVQKMWDRRMHEWVSGQTQRRRKSNRLTGFLE